MALPEVCLHVNVFPTTYFTWLKLRERSKKGHGKGGFGSDSGLCESVQQQVAEIMLD